MVHLWRYNGVTPMETAHRTLRVLVVEDDDDTATSYAILLRLYGYEIAVAADGSSALQAVLASQPDVVLLDIGLPNMDGWQVAKWSVSQMMSGLWSHFLSSPPCSRWSHREAIAKGWNHLAGWERFATPFPQSAQVHCPPGS
jgi:hypothetical protein